MAWRDSIETLRAVAPMLWRALVRGQLFRPQCTLEPPHADVLCEYDLPVPMPDGTQLTANVFRSRSAAARGEAKPVVMCAHPYDNRLIPALGRTPLGAPPQQYRVIPQSGRPRFSVLTSWESPDPNFWVPAGYAVVNLNLPGYANSGGRPSIFSVHQATCFADAIDWVGRQSWCTGAVGLNGVSYLAISQFMVAAGQGERGVPSALRAICPWEGMTDMFRDLIGDGGVAEEGFPPFWWYTEVRPSLNVPEEVLFAEEGDPRRMLADHPFLDDYWRAKTPDLGSIRLPMLVCASFSDQGLHTRGSFRAFRRAASDRKWVYTHRTLKWDSYYSRDVEELTKRFFDFFVKGERDNGFLETAPVRLEVRASRDRVHEVRDEYEWPLARTQYRRLFLAASGSRLAEANPAAAQEIAYDAESGRTTFLFRFEHETELTGYMKLRLWFEARGSDDATLFVCIRKRDGDGRDVPFYGSVGNFHDGVSRGLLRVSRRELDVEESTDWEPVLRLQGEERLRPGEIVALDIALQPSSTCFGAGESLELVIAPKEIVRSPPFRKSAAGNRGLHVLHTGGHFESFLQIPVVPPRDPSPEETTK